MNVIFTFSLPQCLWLVWWLARNFPLTSKPVSTSSRFGILVLAIIEPAILYYGGFFA